MLKPQERKWDHYYPNCIEFTFMSPMMMKAFIIISYLGETIATTSLPSISISFALQEDQVPIVQTFITKHRDVSLCPGPREN